MATAGAIKAGRAYVQLFADDSKLVRGLKRAQMKFKAFGAGLKSLGTKMVGMGIAAATPFAISTKVFATFESRMARVKALTGANEKDFGRLKGAAKKLGRSTVFSASQAAEAMSSFALAGFKVDQILQAVGPTLDLAAAGQIGIAEAADISAKIMAGMGLRADELGKAVDVMAKAMTTANTDLTMLGDAFKFVGPMAKSAGISLEEITAAIQLLSNAGMQGEMAGSTLRGMLLALTSPSAAAEKELDRLGVKVVDDAGNVRSLADILADLERSLSRMGTGQKLKSLGTIFPARQAAGAAELVSQGSEKLRQATKALGKSTGTSSRIAKVQLDTLSGDATILMSALEGLAIELAEGLAPTIRQWAVGLKEAAEWLSNVVQKNRDLFLAIGKTVAIIVGVGAALVALGIIIQGIAFGLGGLATVATAVGAALGLIGTILGVLLSPLGAVIAAVAALGTWLVTSTEVGGEALGWLGDRFGDLKATALSAWQGIADALAAGDIGLAAKILWLTLKMEWKKGVHALNGIWVKVKEFFLSVWTEAVFGAARIATNAWAGLQAAWTETVDFLRDAWVTFTTFIAKNWNKVVGFLKKMWQKLKGAVTGKDTSKAQQEIANETTRMNRELDDQRNKQIAEREQKRKARLKQIESDRSGTIGELEKMREAEHVGRQKRFAKDLQGTEDDLSAARREWQQAIQEAARKRKESEKVGDPKRLGKPNELVDKLKNRLAGVNVGLQKAESKFSVSGTFSAFGVRGLAGGSPAERTAKATEETAKNTKRLLQEARTGGLAFS